MKQLIVMRHTQAEHGTVADGDRRRRLSNSGLLSAAAMGLFMTRAGLKPDVVYCSSSARTRQTWEAVSGSLEQQPEVFFEDNLYCASEQELSGVTLDVEAHFQSLMLVAHNPGVHSFVVSLMSEVADGVDASPVSDGYPPGTLSVLTFDIDDWKDVAPHTGLLTHCNAPE